MRVLLDTHIFLWWVKDDPRLGSRARSIISDVDNKLLLSAASGWEIAIKSKLGKLEITGDIIAFTYEQIQINAISELPVQMNHTLHVAMLPGLHRDPFDRLLVAQSQLERIPILTGDTQIMAYSVEVIKA